MCNCKDMVRTFDDEHATMPISDHHPKCEDYKKERFVKITFEGSSAIVEANEAINYDESEYKKEDMFMTRDQFEKLEEFAGW